jgi:N-acyl-D-amino-acid deacylase
MPPRSLAVLLALAIPVGGLAWLTPEPTVPCDVLFEGGRIVDGTGAPWLRGDLCIVGDRIAGVGRMSAFDAHRRIDASKLVVAPGFIDLLGQSEITVLADNRVASKILQGITTELTGEASFTGIAHRDARRLSQRKAVWDLLDVPEWDDLRGYLELFEAHGSTINLGHFISAGGIRDSVIGKTDRPATRAELEEMKAQVADAMEAGAFGLSSSLQYVPDRFASTEELIALASVAASYGGIYATHQRSEADRIDESLDEVFRIAREARVPVLIHHLKTAYRQTWGRMPAVLGRIEQARAAGLDIAFDQYPYPAASNPLDSSLPPWAREGGRDALVARLRNETTRARIRQEILTPDPSWENQYLGSGGGAGILVASVVATGLKRFEGKTLEEVGRLEGKDPLDALFDLIVNDTATGTGIMFMMHEDDVREALENPLGSLGTDSAGVETEGPTLEWQTHPRAWGSAARILAKYVRDEHVLSLEEAIRKMTSQPASRVGLTDRGILREGVMADVVAFEPDAIRDRATFARPRQYSEGILFVAVNGALVVDGGAITDARPGRALRSPAFREARSQQNPREGLQN